MPFCNKCGDFWYNTHDHVCPPLWFVWVPEDGETYEFATRVQSRHAQDAARMYVEKEDVDEGYPVAVEEQVVTVHVARVDEPQTVHRFTVLGSMNPTYFAEEA